MATSPVGCHGDGQQDQRQAELVAQATPLQQRRIGQFIEGKASCGDGEEALRRSQHGRSVLREAEVVVAGERDPKGEQPTTDIGQQRRQAGLGDQQHDDTEVQRRRHAADEDEPAHAGAFARWLHARHPQRRIAICVDDVGLHAGINRAALELAALGRVSALSCLVGAPAWRACSQSLSPLERDRIDIGLHLDLTEFPLMPASRWSLPALIASAYGGWLKQRLLRAEIAAQLEAFERALGRPPAFVDGHRHVHQLPGVRDVLLELLDQRGSALRPWLRRTRRDAFDRGFKPWAIEALGAAALSRLAARHGLAQNQRLLGVYDFVGGAPRYRALLRAWFAHAGDGDLLMCHPSVTVQAEDRILAARGTEYEVFAGRGLVEMLAEANVVVRPMSQILAPP